jgi:hypothetical protein
MLKNQQSATRLFDVYVVEDHPKEDSEQANWTRVGVAVEIKDGKGFNVHLSTLPINGTLVMRVHEPKHEA